MQPVLREHKYHHFGPYLAEMSVDPDYCARLLKLGKKLKQSHRESLAGQIHHEYLYPIEKEPWIAQWQSEICMIRSTDLFILKLVGGVRIGTE